MNNWTPAAHQVWEDYLAQNRARIQASGGDVEEIVSDLKSHVDAELEAQKVSVVTEQDIRRILAKIGPVPEQQPPLLPAEEPKSKSAIKCGLLLLFGCILPLGTLIFEMSSHACASELFDPIPTLFHILLIAFVPIANALSWWFILEKKTIPTWVWPCNAIAFGISTFYALIFVPITPWAFLGIIFMGFGLIPLSPLIAMICCWAIRVYTTRREQGVGIRYSRMRWWLGFACGFGILVILGIQGALTRHWIAQATDQEKPDINAIQSLRAFGDNEILLRSCYGRKQSDLISWFVETPNVSIEAVRTLYYKVNGESFNSVPPPLNDNRGTGRVIMDDYEWDDALGGEKVAGRIKKLSLAQSRMDGIVNTDEGWSYMEWILEFRNDNPITQREARAQIQLPPGGVVSRVTLWINGAEQEAAFGGRSQVRQAYQAVAVQRRRDPVLVTTCGADRVLVQCFPVPTNGRMKIRLGITAPLGVLNDRTSALRLPCFVERNFQITKTLEHNLWLQSSANMETSLRGLSKTEIENKTGIHGAFTDNDLSSTNAVLRFDTIPIKTPILAADPRVPGQVIEQTLQSIPGTSPSRIAIMLDGSRNMEKYYPAIDNFLKSVSTTTPIRIWRELDGLELMYDSSWGYGSSIKLRNFKAEGGQDNLPGLLHAWDWAAEKKGSVVLWIHADQPMFFENLLALKQRLDWNTGTNAPLIIDAQVTPAPNCLSEEIAHIPSVISLPRYGSFQDDLNRLCSEWFGQTQWQYARRSLTGINTAKTTASDHIVRLWALEQSKVLLRQHQSNEAKECATVHQIVTPVSGAVVLETKAQYDEFGLVPSNPSTVPSVPEPSTLALCAMALVAFLLWKRHIKRKQQKV